MNQLLTTTIGLFLLMTPLPYRVKTVIAWAIAIPSLAISAKRYPEYVKKKGELETVKAKVEKLRKEAENTEYKIKETEEKSRQQLYVKESAIAQQLLKAQQELKLAEQLSAEAEEKRSDLMAECHQQIEKLLKEAEQKAATIQAKKQKEIDQLLNNLGDEEKSILTEAEETKKQAELLKKTAEEEANKIRIVAEKEAELLLNKAKLEAEAITGQIKTEHGTWQSQVAQQMEALKAQIQQEYYDECDEAIAQQIKEIQEAAIEGARAKVAESIETIKKLQEDNKQLKERAMLFYEKLQAQRQVKKPTEFDLFNTTARNLIEYYESQGVNLDFVSARPDSDGSTIVCVNPWRKDSGIEKDIQKFFNALMVHFKLSQTPTCEVTPVGYEIRMTPHYFHYGGLPPVNPYAEKANRFGTAFLNQDEEVDIEEIANNALGDVEARKLLQEQLEKEHIQFMLMFRPPADKIKPASLALEDLEVKWVEWLYKWRSQATGKPNITTQNELMLEVYGISPGRGTDEESLLGESLRSRLHRIMDTLGLPRRKRSEG
ncbi:MAG: hypothetical protein F6K14_10695 [Symploca sp. SIO2C1]|nr:hypothetical protein [Symploca sp. SIO2C1]